MRRGAKATIESHDRIKPLGAALKALRQPKAVF